MNTKELEQEYATTKQKAIDAYKAYWESDAAEDSAEFYHLLREAKSTYEIYAAVAAKLFCMQCEEGLI